MVCLSIALLGTFEVELDRRPVTQFGTEKTRALLAYLAVESARPHHRAALARLLWPDSIESAGRHSLSQALHVLRQALEIDAEAPPFFLTTPQTIQFNPDGDYTLDVAAFEAGVTRYRSIAPRHLSPDQAEALARAVDLYRGDFLAGHALADSVAFEEWLLSYQTALHLRSMEALTCLASCYGMRGDPGQAARYARRQIELDPLREVGYRQLMRALAQEGQRAQALSQYETCRQVLAQELGIEPSPETVALAREIGAGQTAPPPAPPDSRPGFVGREDELARLETFLAQALAGQGGVAFVVGEAGSGKSALLEAFVRRATVAHPYLIAVRGNCSAYTGHGVPYLPFREIVQTLAGDLQSGRVGDALSPRRARHLWQILPQVVEALVEEGPDLIDRLVSRQVVGRYAGETSPQIRERDAPLSQQDLFEQVSRVLLTLARNQPLLLLVDDLHWADSGSISLLFHLGRRLVDSRILLVGAYRPTLLPETTQARHPLTPVCNEFQRLFGDIQIDLDRTGGLSLVEALVDREPNKLGRAFRQTLYQHTHSNPLFTLELLREMEARGEIVRDESGSWVEAHPDWARLPARVEAVIAERMGRLEPDWQDLLATASVEGIEFSAELIAQIQGVDVEWVKHILSGPLSKQHRLVEATRVQRSGRRRLSRYHFSHHFFQAYLYARQDPVERANRHDLIGSALEELEAGTPEASVDRYATLAWHFEGAKRPLKAVAYLLRAGQQAYRLAAPEEAINLYRHGLELLAPLPASAPRDRLELELQMKLDPPLLVTQGWGAPERAAVLKRAHILARQLRETDRLLIILYTLADLCTAQAKHPQALAYAEQLLALAQQAGDHVYEALGYRMVGTAHFFLGNFRTARATLEDGIACYAKVTRQALRPEAAALVERAVFLWAWLPHTLLILGYPDQAAARSREALEHVRLHGPAYAQAMMLMIAGVSFNVLARRPRATLRYTGELLALTEEYDFAAFRGWAIFYQGWARAVLGETETGLVKMTAGWETLQATGTQGTLPHLLTLWAEVRLSCGEVEKGERILNRALALTEDRDERFYLAETYRLQGELLDKKEVTEEAERCFERALSLAQEQSAKLWELRAAVQLARLSMAQGRPQSAHLRLSEIYGWFTEGADTPDLQSAGSLLRDLGTRIK
jgi:DNA-binding SARP family transcriptional activator